MPNNDARRVHIAHRDYFDKADSGERSFPSLEAEKIHDLACAIIEQAVYDWMTLDYGKLGFAPARNGNSYIYRAEVEAFFKGKWFEYLMEFCLPSIDPSEVRRELRIAEPERRVPCASC